MLAQRLKQLRLARGWSLDELSECLGGLVTKQALSKYEKGLSNPSLKVVAKIAETFGIKTAQLFAEPSVQVQLLAYRKCAALPKRDEYMVEGMVSQALEERIALQEKVGEVLPLNLPAQKYRVATMDDAEQAAVELRKFWNLGTSPVSSVTELLEDQFIHVFTISTASDKFDGTSAVARDDQGAIVAAAVVSRDGASGERQRFSLMHEVGHLVLNVADGVDEEKAAHRFAGAFLVPADLLRREIGAQRTTIQLKELFMLKRRFGMSAQALAFRMRDLGIINDSGYKWLCIQFNHNKMRKSEPEALPQEEPQWLTRTVLRAFSEGLITAAEAEHLTGEPYASAHKELIDRRAFMKLSAAERSKVLQGQAEHLKEHYAAMKGLGGGDFLDY
jgi:Zn-dependent peptidase ImmA (M78 family)/DNA-binding XRE family transcriptional regulator